MQWREVQLRISAIGKALARQEVIAELKIGGLVLPNDSGEDEA